MNKLLFTLTTALFVVMGCAPRDVANKSNRPFGNNNSGGVSAASNKTAFTVTEDGDRAPTCPEKNQDYKTIAITEDELESIIDGSVKAIIEPGNRNCFRIGSLVQLKASISSSEVLGEVIITKTEGIALTKLAKKHADAFGMSKEELKDRGQELIDAVTKFKPEGMVTITYFKVPGAEGDDEEEIKSQEPVELFTTILTKKGERPASCAGKSAWTRISIPEEQDENVKSGQVLAWYSPGKSNCFEVGTKIQAKEKDGPVRMEMKVTRIEVVPANQLSALHGMAMGMSLLDLKELVNADEELVNLIYFEYLSSPTASAAE